MCGGGGGGGGEGSKTYIQTIGRRGRRVWEKGRVEERGRGGGGESGRTYYREEGEVVSK